MRRPLNRLSIFSLSLGLGLGLLIASGAGEPTAVAEGGDAQVPASGQFDRQPVLIYNVSGGFLAGTTDSSLVVYNDGLAILGELTDFGGPPAEFNQTQAVYVGPGPVDELRVALGKAGASTLPDGVGVVADIPTSTVTYFRATASSVRANTFSFTGGFGAYGDVQLVINEFINTYFPPAGG